MKSRGSSKGRGARRRLCGVKTGPKSWALKGPGGRTISRHRSQRATTEAGRRIGKRRARRGLATEVTVQGRKRRWARGSSYGGDPHPPRG